MIESVAAKASNVNRSIKRPQTRQSRIEHDTSHSYRLTAKSVGGVPRVLPFFLDSHLIPFFLHHLRCSRKLTRDHKVFSSGRIWLPDDDTRLGLWGWINRCLSNRGKHWQRSDRKRKLEIVRGGQGCCEVSGTISDTEADCDERRCVGENGRDISRPGKEMIRVEQAADEGSFE